MTHQLCSKRPSAPRTVEANPAVLGPVRASLMSQSRRRWVQGSKLTWAVDGGSAGEKDVVRWAFDTWKPHVPGLVFKETTDWAKAVVRISINRSGEAWSYVGTDVGKIPPSEQTMNLGWSLLDAWGRQTALHELGHCLDGDTLIDCPRDLGQYPLGIPLRDLVGQKPWVYAYCDGAITVRRAARVWMSKRLVPTVRVHLGTGHGGRRGDGSHCGGSRSRTFLPPLELVGTPDHPVLLSDGETWKNLGDLQPGDRLFSLYRQKNHGYPMIYWTGLQSRVYEHSFICEQINGPRPEGCHCHHKDGSTQNQSVGNLEWKDKHDHARDHGRQNGVSDKARVNSALYWKGRRHTEESRAKMISASTKTALARRKEQAAAANHVVVSVEPAGMRDVYDMTVPGADSFIANGVVVHNCLGYEHEHQSPYAGIVWNVTEVLRVFGGPPNFWLPEQVFSQVLDKLPQVAVQGTLWDRDSVMHYPFEGGLIDRPEELRNGLIPPLGLSAADVARALLDYPCQEAVVPAPVEVTEEKPLVVTAGHAAETVIHFTTGKGTVRVNVAGAGDTLLVALDAEGAVIGADDDSGTENSAAMTIEALGGTVRLTVRPVWVPDGAEQPEVTVSVVE